jgi:hypothetical protein
MYWQLGYDLTVVGACSITMKWVWKENTLQIVAFFP